MSPRNPDRGREREKLTPEELFDYMGGMGNDMLSFIMQLKALYEEAQEKGIKVDLLRILEYSQPRNIYSEQLVNMQRALISSMEEMCEQDGVKITSEKMRERFEKMGL